MTVFKNNRLFRGAGRRSLLAGAALAASAALLLPAAGPASADMLEVTLLSISSTVRPGEANALVIHTGAGASCTADIHSHRPAGKTGGDMVGHLGPRTANPEGMARWQWKVNGIAGHRTVNVHCVKGDSAGDLSVGFDVT